jgi:hypothetical protein
MIKSVVNESIVPIPKFHGEYYELRLLFAPMNLRGEWSDEPHGVMRFRCRDGSSVHWAQTTGTVWTDGPTGPRVALTNRVRGILASIPPMAALAEIPCPGKPVNWMPPVRAALRQRARRWA